MCVNSFGIFNRLFSVLYGVGFHPVGERQTKLPKVTRGRPTLLNTTRKWPKLLNCFMKLFGCLRNYLKTVCFADKHRWTLWKGAADGQKETCREAVAHDLAGTR